MKLARCRKCKEDDLISIKVLYRAPYSGARVVAIECQSCGYLIVAVCYEDNVPAITKWNEETDKAMAERREKWNLMSVDSNK